MLCFLSTGNGLLKKMDSHDEGKASRKFVNDPCLLPEQAEIAPNAAF